MEIIFNHSTFFNKFLSMFHCTFGKMNNNGKIEAARSRSFRLYLLSLFDRSVSKFASRVGWFAPCLSAANYREKQVRVSYCVLLSLSAPTIFIHGDSHDAPHARVYLSFSRLRNAQYSHFKTRRYPSETFERRTLHPMSSSPH